MRNNATAANAFTSIAVEHTHAGNMGHASALLDLAQGFMSGAQQCVDAFGVACDMSERAVQGLCDIADRTKDILKERVPELVKSIPKLVGMDIGLTVLLKVPYLPLKMALAAGGIALLAAHTGYCGYKYFSLVGKDPVEANAKAAAHIIELLTIGYGSHKVKQQLPALQRHATRLYNIVKAELKFAAAAGALTSAGAQQLAPLATAGPVTSALTQAEKIAADIYQLAQKDLEAAEMLMGSVKIHAEGAKKSAIEDWLYFKNFPKNRTESTAVLPIKHIKKAEIGPHGITKRDIIKGGHCKLDPNFEILELVKKPNQFGVYMNKIKLNGIEKTPCFYPESWDEAMIINKLQEAGRFERRVFIEPRGFVGKTKEGMFIQFWYESEMDNVYSSAYPYMEETLINVLKAKFPKGRK